MKFNRRERYLGVSSSTEPPSSLSTTLILMGNFLDSGLAFLFPLSFLGGARWEMLAASTERISETGLSPWLVLRKSAGRSRARSIGKFSSECECISRACSWPEAVGDRGQSTCLAISLLTSDGDLPLLTAATVSHGSLLLMLHEPLESVLNLSFTRSYQFVFIPVVFWDGDGYGFWCCRHLIWFFCSHGLWSWSLSLLLCRRDVWCRCRY